MNLYQTDLVRYSTRNFGAEFHLLARSPVRDFKLFSRMVAFPGGSILDDRPAPAVTS
jgi:hypothetical protein